MVQSWDPQALDLISIWSFRKTRGRDTKAVCSEVESEALTPRPETPTSFGIPCIPAASRVSPLVHIIILCLTLSGLAKQLTVNWELVGKSLGHSRHICILTGVSRRPKTSMDGGHSAGMRTERAGISGLCLPRRHCGHFRKEWLGKRVWGGGVMLPNAPEIPPNIPHRVSGQMMPICPLYPGSVVESVYEIPHMPLQV